MGLDISAEAKKFGMAKGKEFHRWRKHHELLTWCDKLNVSHGAEPWLEPATLIELTVDDLDRLEAAVRAGELPDFYDGSDCWREHDLAFIEKARKFIAEGFWIEVSFSW